MCRYRGQLIGEHHQGFCMTTKPDRQVWQHTDCYQPSYLGNHLMPLPSSWLPTQWSTMGDPFPAFLPHRTLWHHLAPQDVLATPHHNTPPTFDVSSWGSYVAKQQGETKEQVMQTSHQLGTSERGSWNLWTPGPFLLPPHTSGVWQSLEVFLVHFPP